MYDDTESQIQQQVLCQQGAYSHFVVPGLNEGNLGTSQNYSARDTLKRTVQDLLQNDLEHSKSSSLVRISITRSETPQIFFIVVF